MDELRRRLDQLKHAATCGKPTPRPTRDATRPTRPADVFGGRECRCAGLACWQLETPFEEACPDHGLTHDTFVGTFQADQTPEPLPIAPRRTLVIDIETGGFSGTPVFLIGAVLLDRRPLCVRQWLARDYPEERAILQRLAELADRRTTWVTFNGKSFDAPFVLERATIHGVALTPPEIHFDLLHAARRRWGAKLPDCRLETLERHILGRKRVGDVPGCDIPNLFHHFIKTGNAAPLRPVLEHNQVDLITSTELLVRLSVSC